MNAERHQRLMGILGEALECDPSQNLIADSCAGDDSLRQEIERLLKHETEAAGFMKDPLFGSTWSLPSEAEESLIGRRIGSYQITREIGRGGMGTVYLAMRSDNEFQRHVAIKLIKRGMDTELIQRRFRNERQILASLDHQNIARLFDGGTTEDGVAFLVMEFVKGQPIDVYSDTQRLSTVERLRLFLIVCEAVQYAHRNSVIHRDLKPSNLLVNEEGVPKLLDFGIAKVLHSESTGDQTDTANSAWRVLTPEYASPEQIRGEPSTTRSDVYSLGAVLYELLTGHRPHRSDKSSSDEMAKAIISQTPAKPSTVISRIERLSSGTDSRTQRLTPKSVSDVRDGAPERLRRSLRGDLDNIVLTALRREPHRRYASVEEFSSDIRRHLEGLPILARKDTLAYRSTKFFKRHKASVIATLAVALLCLVLGVLLASLFRTPPTTAASIAVLPLANANGNLALEDIADGLTDGLIENLSRLPKLTVSRHESVFYFKGQSLDPREVGRLLNVNTILKGTVQSDNQKLAINLSLIDAESAQIIWSKQYEGFLSEMLPLQERIAEDVSRSLGMEPITETPTQKKKHQTEDAEAYRLYLLGRYFWNKRTMESCQKGIEYFKAATERDPNYALAYSGLADCYGLLGAYILVPADQAFPAAKAAARRAIELDESLAEGHVSLALTLWLYDWNWAGADAEFRRAIELNPQYVTAHHWRGLFLGEMGRFDEAIAEMQQALAYDPISAPILADFGRVYYWARRYGEALEKYHKAREIAIDFGAYESESSELYELLGNDNSYSEYEKLGWFMGEDRSVYLRRGSRPYLLMRLPLTPPGIVLAEVHARLREVDKAFDALDEAFRIKDHRMSQLKVNPKLDNLRSHPRFREQLRRMNLIP